MTSKLNITKWGKILILIISATLLLSACSSSDKPLNGEEAQSNGTDVTCWQAEVLSPIYKVIGATVMKMYDQLSTGAMSLMMIGFSVWLALRLMKFVSSVAEENAGEIWNEILKKAFICLLCGIMASSSTMLLYVINTFLFPLYQAFLDFGSKILELANSNVSSVTVLGQTVEIKANTTCQVPAGAGQATLEGFPSGFQDMMSCMICAVNERLVLGRNVALIAMSAGGVVPLVVGGLVWLIFLVVSAGFVFYFVDSIFRFGMMILLLPIFIMSYAFGPTKKWSGIGFENIMNSSAFMMAFCMLVATTLMAMVTLIKDNAEVFSPATDPYEAAIHLREFSVTMMCLLLIGFLVFGSLKVAQQLTSAIVGGKTSAKFQENLKAVLQMVVGWATGGLSAFWNKLALSQTSVGRAIAKSNQLNDKLKDLAGRK